jgi:hypothetical protein
MEVKPLLDAFGALAVGLIAAVGAALGGYALAYAKKKGAGLATKEDFNELIRQVQRTTEATEQVKAAISARGAIGGELRESVRKLTVTMASMLHSMCWITWSADRRGRLTDKDVWLYDEEVHKLSPDILGYLTSVAALDLSVYERLEPLVWELFDMDVRIGNACVIWQSEPALGQKAVADLQKPSGELMVRLPKEVAGIIGHVAVKATAG